jgi:hypothetical protein
MTPDLSIGLEPADPKQALSLVPGAWTWTRTGDNACAAVEIFHTCRGSNNCHAQGGCGFVQPVSGGGNCGSAVVTRGGVEGVECRRRLWPAAPEAVFSAQ